MKIPTERLPEKGRHKDLHRIINQILDCLQELRPSISPTVGIISTRAGIARSALVGEDGEGSNDDPRWG